jgi:hypothetical protein
MDTSVDAAEMFIDRLDGVEASLQHVLGAYVSIVDGVAVSRALLLDSEAVPAAHGAYLLQLRYTGYPRGLLERLVDDDKGSIRLPSLGELDPRRPVDLCLRSFASGQGGSETDDATKCRTKVLGELSQELSSGPFRPLLHAEVLIALAVRLKAMPASADRVRVVVQKERGMVASLLFTFQSPVALAAVTTCVRRLPMVVAPRGLTVFPVSNPADIIPAFAVVHGGVALQFLNFLHSLPPAVVRGAVSIQVTHLQPMADYTARRESAAALCAAASEFGLRGLPEVVVQAVCMTRVLSSWSDHLTPAILMVLDALEPVFAVAFALHRAAALLQRVVVAPVQYVMACIGWPVQYVMACIGWAMNL